MMEAHVDVLCSSVDAVFLSDGERRSSVCENWCAQQRNVATNALMILDFSEQASYPADLFPVVESAMYSASAVERAMID